MDPSEVSVHHKLEKEEQPIAAEIRVELGKEVSFPHKYVLSNTR
jgi:hypothetical protein